MTDFILHTEDSAPANSKELLNNVQTNFEFLPLLFRHMAEAPVVLESLLTLMSLVSKTSLSPAQQQIASLAASVENDCINCMAGHCFLGKTVNAEPQSLDALYKHHDIRDAKDLALATFTRAVVKNRGRQSDAEVNAFLAAGFTKQQVLEVILIVTYKTLTNYTNHLTDSPADEEILAALSA